MHLVGFIIRIYISITWFVKTQHFTTFINDTWLIHNYFSSLISLAFPQAEVTAIWDTIYSIFQLRQFRLSLPMSLFTSYMQPSTCTLLWALSCCKISVHLSLSIVSLLVVPQSCCYLQHRTVQPTARCHGRTNGNQQAWTDINDLSTFVLLCDC